MRVCVDQGTIHVNSVIWLARHEGAFVLSADCRQKYPKVDDLDGGEGGGVVYLATGPDTLGAEPGTKRTAIRMALDGSWHLSAEAGRYSVLIMGIRRQVVPVEQRSLWTDDTALAQNPSAPREPVGR
jgi:hypothetical protein